MSQLKDRGDFTETLPDQDKLCNLVIYGSKGKGGWNRSCRILYIGTGPCKVSGPKERNNNDLPPERVCISAFVRGNREDVSVCRIGSWSDNATCISARRFWASWWRILPY